MADAVVNTVLLNSPKQHIVHLTCISDGTGEAAVVKIDKSTLLATDSAEPNALDLEFIEWVVQGFSSVVLLWEHTTDDVCEVLSGSGFRDYTLQGFIRDLNGTEGKKDPRSAGGTGDVVLTSTGASATATYSIVAGFRKAAA